MNKATQFIVFLFSVVIAGVLWKYLVYDIVIPLVPFPFNWLLALIIAGGELFGLAKEAKAIFSD